MDPKYLSILLLVLLKTGGGGGSSSFQVENHGQFLYKCFENVSENAIDIPGLLQLQYIPEKLDFYTERFNKSSPFHFSLLQRPEEGNCPEEFEIKIPKVDDGATTFSSFTPAGMLVYARQEEGFTPQEVYYHPDNFCVSIVTPDHIGVRVCKSQCHIQDGEKGNSICLPKCCTVGQVMTGNRCVSRPSDRDWRIPNIYSTLRSLSPKGVQPQFQFNYINYHWNCSAYSQTENSLFLKSKELKILEDGRIFQKHPFKKWAFLYKGGGDRQFCLDTYVQRRNETLSDLDEELFILFTCRSKLDDSFFTYPQLLFGVTLVSSLIHLMTVSVYIALWDSQNVHGWTAFILAGSQCLLNFFLCVLFAFFGFSSPEKTLAGPLRPLCIGIGIFHHFLLICTFSWSTVFSFDAWSKIRSMTPRSRGSKGKKRFLAYCGFGFGIPTLVLFISILIEFTTDQEDSVVRPGYSLTCVIQHSLEYLFYITVVIVTLFGVNMIMAVHTIMGVFEAKKGVQMFKDSTKSASVDNQSKLIIKFFVLMGAFLVFEIILAFLSPISISLYFAVLDFYRIFHAVGFFYIFAWNKKTGTQLALKFPKLVILFPVLAPVVKNVSVAVNTQETAA